MSFVCSSKYIQYLCILLIVAVTSIFRLFLNFILELRLWRIIGGMFGE